MVATRSQPPQRKQWQVDAKDIRNMASIEAANYIKGNVSVWLTRFGKDQYVMLGMKAMIQDIFWLLDPLLLPIADAYTIMQTHRMQNLLHDATTPEKANSYRKILATWEADITKAPEPHRSICVSRFGQEALHKLAVLQGDEEFIANLAFFFQPDYSTHVSLVQHDFGKKLIGPPAAVLNRNSSAYHGYDSGSTNVKESRSPPHTKGPWSFWGTLPDYRWQKVEQWALNMNDYETLRRIGVKTVMFRGGDHSQRIFAQELTLLQAIFTAVENATSLISAPYDAYVEEDMTALISPSEINFSVADYDEEQKDINPDPNLLIIENPTPSLIRGRPVQVGQAPRNLTLSEKKQLAARYRKRRTSSDIQRRKRARVDAHDRNVRAELAQKAAKAAAAARAEQTMPGRVLRAGAEKVGGWLNGGREKGQGGVRKVQVVKGREPNVAVGVRAEMKSPVKQKRVSEVVLSSDPESE